MANYIFAYHGGEQPKTPEEGKNMMEKWKGWIENLGSTMVNPGTPLGMSKTVSADGIADNGGSNPLTGYSVVGADSIEAALEIAKGSPFLEIGGTIEVAEMKEK